MTNILAHSDSGRGAGVKWPAFVCGKQMSQAVGTGKGSSEELGLVACEYRHFQFSFLILPFRCGGLDTFHIENDLGSSLLGWN